MSDSPGPAIGRDGGLVKLGSLIIPYEAIGDARLMNAISEDPGDYAFHIDAHGPLPRVSFRALLEVLDRADLRGCGGARYPVADKLRALRAGRTPLVVVNGAEGEPGSAKDHLLLAIKPHLVFDGAVAVARAIGAKEIVVAVTDPHLVEILDIARRRRPHSHLIRIRQLEARYITGEGGALISALNGGNGLPPGRRRHATERGFRGAPTLLCNVETWAQVALAILTDSNQTCRTNEWTGANRHSGVTTRLLTVTGAAAKPGVYEIPTKIRLREIMRIAGVNKPQAVVIGGYHGSWLSPDPELSLSAAALSEVKATLGPGVIAFLGQDTCPLGELAAVAQWLAHESAKQCQPCKLGLPALADNLTALSTGTSADPTEVDIIQQLGSRINGNGACSHPDGATRFIRNGLEFLSGDIATHRKFGGCDRDTKGYLALTKADALTPPTPPASQEILMSVDLTRCKGNGHCAALLSGAVSFDGQLHFPKIDQTRLATVPRRALLRAVSACPALALRLGP